MSGSIHATAIVAPDAVLGEGVEIGPYSVIGPDVEIGARTRIGPHAVGHRPHADRRATTSSSFASVGDAPQDKKYAGEPTRLVIGDRNVIREFVTLNRGTTKDRGVTAHRQRQPVHVLLARRARLHRRQPHACSPTARRSAATSCSATG